MALTMRATLPQLRTLQQNAVVKSKLYTCSRQTNKTLPFATRQLGTVQSGSSGDDTLSRTDLQNLEEQTSSAAHVNLLERILTTSNSSGSTAWALAAVLGAVAVLGAAEPALAASQSPHEYNVVGDIAENEEFWSNVLRYISYFFSVLLGTAYVAIKPIIELMKRPTTAVLVLAGAGLLFFFVSTTVSAMLGMNELIEYEPSSIVTPNL